MTPEQRDLILGQVTLPGQPELPLESRQAALLDAFDADDGRGLAVRLLRDAERERNGDDVEAAFVATAIFGVSDSALPVMSALARQPWHNRHTEIARYLGDFGAAGNDVVDDLNFLAWAGADYQDYEGSTTLTSQAIHALGRVATPQARAELHRLQDYPDDNIRATVRRVESRMPPATA